MAQQEYKLLSDNMFTYKGGVFLTDEEKMDLTPDVIDNLEHFDVRDDDLFVVTFPKSGTVWTQRIVTLIFQEDFPEMKESTTFQWMPWLEYQYKGLDYNSQRSPRLFCSHLHQHIMPSGLQRKKAKVIYVSRNPKDVLVSYMHFSQFMRKLESPAHWDDMMDKFCTGWMMGGCWFDHVRDWYKNHDKFNILFLTYEEMIKDLRAVVVRVCAFVGKQVSDAAVDDIVIRATFDNMKNDKKANYEFLPDDVKDTSKGRFLRRGTVGDWKNHLTVAQSERFDRVYEEKMKGFPVKFAWDMSDL